MIRFTNRTMGAWLANSSRAAVPPDFVAVSTTSAEASCDSMSSSTSFRDSLSSPKKRRIASSICFEGATASWTSLPRMKASSPTSCALYGSITATVTVFPAMATGTARYIRATQQLFFTDQTEIDDDLRERLAGTLVLLLQLAELVGADQVTLPQQFRKY